MKRYILLLVGAALLISGCSNDSASVTLSAAASTRDAMEEIVEIFNASYPDIEVDINFGGSGALKMQIEQGAPVDIFLSANINHYQDLVDGGYIDEGITYLENQLVLITPADEENITSIDNLEQSDRIALGTPESVPAGEYSTTALIYYGLWETLESRIVYAEDVRQVLQYVEVGEVDAGIVYQSDALSSSNINIVETFDAASHDAIEYPLGLLKSAADKKAVVTFYEFLQTDVTLEVFNKYGFTTR